MSDERKIKNLLAQVTDLKNKLENAIEAMFIESEDGTVEIQQDGTVVDLSIKKEIEKINDKIKNIELTPGKDGRDGIDGTNGQDGRDGIDGKDGRDGIDGTNGQDGRDGIDGKDGRDGLDGKDGENGLTYLGKANTQPFILSAGATVKPVFDTGVTRDTNKDLLIFLTVTSGSRNDSIFQDVFFYPAGATATSSTAFKVAQAFKLSPPVGSPPASTITIQNIRNKLDYQGGIGGTDRFVLNTISDNVSVASDNTVAYITVYEIK